SLLLHRGIRDELRHPLVRAFKPKSRNPYLRMDMDFLIRGAFDGDVTGRVRQFETNRARDVEGVVKAAGSGWSKGASRESQGDGQRRYLCGELGVSRHRSSVILCSGIPRAPTPKIRLRRELCSGSSFPSCM